MPQQNQTITQIQQAIQQIERAIAPIRPAALWPNQALEAWEDLKPMRRQLEATLDKLNNLSVALAERSNSK
ncbi:MAG: hypothetical protein SNJ57_16285 [Cyanobacteriota bacterium]